VISGVPAGYSLSEGQFIGMSGGTSTWSLRRRGDGTTEWGDAKLVGWPTHYAGTRTLTASMVVTEDDGAVGTTTRAVPIVVSPQIDDFNPSVSALGREDEWFALSINAGLVDTDGSERVTGNVTLGSIPTGTQLRVAGVVQVPAASDGGFDTYIVASAQIGAIEVKGILHSNVDFTGTGSLTIAEFDSSRPQTHKRMAVLREY